MTTFIAWAWGVVCMAVAGGIVLAWQYVVVPKSEVVDEAEEIALLAAEMRVIEIFHDEVERQHDHVRREDW